MDSVNKTLYIPLYGKAYVSEKGIILEDKKAEEIWEKAGFELKGKAASKWLAYTMAMRSKVFDEWVKEKMTDDCVVLHLGCGLDSRVLRVNASCQWYDLDFKNVIQERRKYFEETDTYHMLEADLRLQDWIKELPSDKKAIVIMEGVSMYISCLEMNQLFMTLKNYFGEVELLLDYYSEFAAKVSKYKNPINEVGVTKVYGINDPAVLNKMKFVCAHDMTPEYLIKELPEKEQKLFRRLYAGKFAKSLYRMAEFSGKRF